MATKEVINTFERNELAERAAGVLARAQARAITALSDSAARAKTMAETALGYVTESGRDVTDEERDRLFGLADSLLRQAEALLS